MKIFRNALAILLLAGACALARVAVSQVGVPGPFSWRELAFGLPSSIRVYEGVARGASGEIFRAWRADVDLNDRSLRVWPSLASTPDGRERPSAQARKVGALVAINGGYFQVEGQPAKTYSLVLRDGKILAPNVEKVGRGGKTYFVTRSAFGIFENRKSEVAWVGNFQNQIFKFPAPVLKLMGKGETSAQEYSRQETWSAENAIGGGPRLIHDGKIEITYRKELFPGSGFPDEANYSRAAIGSTQNKHLILFVTGQKSDADSVGLTLAQLALEMKKLGCVEAMNLDGGGSQSLVVEGRCLNRGGADAERETTSIFAIVPNKKSAEKRMP
jgi:hypothetical protein